MTYILRKKRDRAIFYLFSSSPVLHCKYMKITIKNCRKLPKIITCSSMRVIISLYVQLIFLFVDGAVSRAIYYKNFLDGNSVRVIISLYV